MGQAWKCAEILPVFDLPRTDIVEVNGEFSSLKISPGSSRQVPHVLGLCEKAAGSGWHLGTQLRLPRPSVLPRPLRTPGGLQAAASWAGRPFQPPRSHAARGVRPLPPPALLAGSGIPAYSK